MSGETRYVTRLGSSPCPECETELECFADHSVCPECDTVVRSVPASPPPAVTGEGSTAGTEAPEVESHAARLTRLRTTWPRKLRPGCIHVRCHVCGRKQSNTARAIYDPPTAVLIETLCGKCAMRSKDPESFYFNAAGEEIEEQYCAVCGTHIDVPEQMADGLCGECADDAATDPLALAVSRSTPNAERDP